MVEKKDIHVRKYQSIGWRSAEVTIMESAIINNNGSYFLTHCTTSNLINPLSPNIHIQILQTGLHTFP